MFRRWIFLLALLMSAHTAYADGEVQKLMTPADKARLETYDRVRKEALGEAQSGSPADVAVLNELANATPIAFSGLDLTGAWQCRTIKVGGNLPVIVYGWFKCRVTDDGAGWQLEKPTGSQRTKGRFYDDGEKRLIYLGSFFVAGEEARKYGSGLDSDQVGYAFRTGEASWRIELPSPRYESKLDIMELRR